MNQKSTVMLAVFVALGVTLVAGLIVIPAIHEAQALRVKPVEGGKHLGQIKNGGGPPCTNC